MLELMLLKEVPGLGDPGDVVKVRPGYARNFLLPRRLAAPVSPDSLRQAQGHKRRLATVRAKRDQEARAQADVLANMSIHVDARAQEDGHLYGSVTPTMIAAAINKEGVNIDDHQIELAEPIKELGIYEVVVKLLGDMTATVKLYVVQPAPPTD